MKKALILSIVAIISLPANEYDPLPTMKKSIVLLTEQMKSIQLKVSDQQKKIDALEEAVKKRSTFSEPTSPTTALKTQSKDKKLSIIVQDLYRVKVDVAPAYEKPDNHSRMRQNYLFGDIVKIVKKGDVFYKNHKGYWVHKDHLEKMDLTKEKFNPKLKVHFYKVNTYLANFRSLPSLSSNELKKRVLKKDDIVKVIDKVTGKEGVWYKVDMRAGKYDVLYVKDFILSPMPVTKR